MAVYDYLTTTGVIVADTADTRNEVITEYRDIFGEDLITDNETPEGLLIDAETTSRQSVARNNAAIANQINPDIAGGPFLDAIWALTGGQRSQGRRSQVNVTITGTASTILPRGTRARTAENDIFRSSNTVIIPPSGTVENIVFESEEFGPVVAGPDSLIFIVDSVLGWESITNPASAVLGVEVESDVRARNTRRQQIALNARSLPQAVISRVSAVDGVRSLAFRENTTGATEIIDGISLVEHSVWIAVEGGNNNDIALALLDSKTAGANWNGAQSVTIEEPVSRQDYTILFDRPTTVDILVRVNIRQLESAESPIQAVRNSILNYASGNQNGEDGFVVGADVSPFELSSAVNIDNPQFFVSLCEVAVKMENPVYQSTTLTINLNQLARIAIDQDITVVLQ